VEDQLEQVRKQTTTGSCGYYPQLPVVALHLIKRLKKTNVSFVRNLQNPP